MNIENMKVSTKLSLGFGSVCILLMIIIGIGLARLGTVNDELSDVVNDKWHKISLATEILTQTNNIAIALRNMMLTEDKNDRQKQIDSILESRKITKEAVEKLQQTLTLPKGKELLQQIMNARTQYIAGQDTLMGLIAANKPEEAKTFLATELRPTLRGYKGAAENLIKFQVELITTTAEASDTTYKNARNLMIGLGLLSILLAVVIGAWITRSLMKDLGGEPSMASGIAHAVAQGDLSLRIDVKPGDSTSLMAHLKEMQDSLVKVVSNVRQGSESVATASAEIAQGNQDLSARTESQASALEQTAASMEELSSTVKQNADNAKQANQLAQSASGVAVKGGEVVAQVVDTMKGINDSSKKIADIISVIDGIAFQTNILALNAAVEAARAGEQGRGFAVVASEVRSLAGRSADAAKEIKTLISASVERVEQGTTLVDQAGVTMTEVVSSIRRVTDIMGEISAASNEQSLGVAQVGDAVTQMDQVTQQNAALVEEMAAAASSLKSQAQDLVQTVAVFKLSAQSATGVPSMSNLAVRSPLPKNPPYKGEERRATPCPASKPRTSPAATASVPAAQKPASKPAPAAATAAGGNDSDWETF
jgi:methyl-accepting chemotaxis protein